MKSTSDSTSDSVWFHVMSRSRPEAQHGPLLHPRPMGLSQHGSRLEKHRRVRMNCVCRVCRLSVDAQIAIHNCQALQCFMLENRSLFGWMYNNCSGGHKFVANFWLSVASYARACYAHVQHYPCSKFTTFQGYPKQQKNMNETQQDIPRKSVAVCCCVETLKWLTLSAFNSTWKLLFQKTRVCKVCRLYGKTWL